MNSNKGFVVKFKDKYGEKRIIHRGKNGLAIQRQRTTATHKLNPIVAALVGQRIKEERVRQGYTLEELCLRAGLSATTSPKSRMWEIENNVRREGLRGGTLYAIALALGVEATDLLPSVKEVSRMAGVTLKDIQTIAV